MDSDNLPAVTRFEPGCLLCICGNGICKYLALKNNPSQFIYKCLTPNCSEGKNDIFKYKEQVTPEDIFIDVPYCACGAGLCRVHKFKDGENAGRILFSCTIKEGQGSCGYKVVLLVDPNAMLPPSTVTPHRNIDPQNVNMVWGNSPREKGPGILRTCSGSKKMNQSLQCQEDELGEPSCLPYERLHDEDLEGATPPVDCLQAQRLVSIASADLSKNYPGAGTSILSRCNNKGTGHLSKRRQLQWQGDESSLPNKRLCYEENKAVWGNIPARTLNGALPRVPSHLEPSGMFAPDNYTSDLVPDAYDDLDNFAEDVKNNLVIVLEKMDSKDHEAMKREAGTTFYILDSMSIDYGDLKQQVTELIDSAKSLEDIETELSCSEAEVKEKEYQLEELLKKKQMSEMKCANASRTVEDPYLLEELLKEKQMLQMKCADASQALEDLHLIRGVRRIEAEDAFDKAWAKLRR